MDDHFSEEYSPSLILPVQLEEIQTDTFRHATSLRIDPKAFAKKKSGGRRRRRSVVCSSSKVDSNWKPVTIPKAEAQLAEILQVISKNILFQSMTGAERKMLANVMSEKRFEAGSVIIKQGDDGDNFYILSSGSIQITKEGVEGIVST